MHELVFSESDLKTSFSLKFMRIPSFPTDDSSAPGNAPWMGSLRHVKGPASFVKAPHPQFKRYPDEDAPNPYAGHQGELEVIYLYNQL